MQGCCLMRLYMRVPPHHVRPSTTTGSNARPRSILVRREPLMPSSVPSCDLQGTAGK